MIFLVALLAIPKTKMVTTLCMKGIQEINFDQIVSNDKSTNKL